MKRWLLLFLGTLLLFHVKGTSQDMGGGHEQWEYILEDTGDVLQFALPISAGLMTWIHKDFKGTKKFVFSYATSAALTFSLKAIIHKRRPEGSNQYNAFPSGHTSSAFSGASFIQRRYGWKYGIPAYLLASIVGVSRMEAPDGYHDIWDVLAGAVVGIGSTYLFTTPFQKQHYAIGFVADEKSVAFSFSYTF